MRTKPCLSSADVLAMAAASRAEAQRIGINVTIVIVDDGAKMLYLERMDGAKVMSIEVATQKAYTSAISQRPTVYWSERAATSNAFLKLPDILPLQGGVPILVRNDCIGAVGVSGGSGEQDEQIANAGIATLIV